jgi:hypothetical protein
VGYKLKEEEKEKIMNGWLKWRWKMTTTMMVVMMVVVMTIIIIQFFYE